MGVRKSLESGYRGIGESAYRGIGVVAANYRAAGLARSRKEFIAKLGLVIEEADESLFWLDYITTLDPGAPRALTSLTDEGRQLVRIFKASRTTARRNASE